MAHDSGIRLFIAGTTQIYKIIEYYLDSGWSLEFLDEINLLPPGDKENCNWIQLRANERVEALSIIREKSDAHETVGVSLIWEGTDMGVNALFSDDNSILFSIVINRKILENTEFTDVSWYLPKILKPLSNNNIFVEYIEWREQV